MAEEKSSTKKEKPKGKNKSGLIWGIVGGVLALGLAVALFFLFKGGPAPNDPKASPSYTKSFFIYDNSKYTLWNADGKRLTEDEYDSKSTFIGGFAYVKKGSEYALINDQGKIIVNFGQISEIEDNGGGLYLTKGNDGVQRLMTGDGKVVAGGDNIELVTASSSAATIVAARVGAAYEVYNYAGQHMAQYVVSDNEDEELHISSYDDFGYVYYAGFNSVFDNRTGREIASWSGKRYSLEDISEDRTTILLSEYEDEEDYKLITNGKLYDLNETKYYGMVRGTNMVVGYDDYNEIAFLGADYKVAKRVNSDVAIKDLNNYATVNDDGEVEIYRNGEVVKKFSEDADMESGVLLYEDYYVIENNGKVGFYRLDGSQVLGEYEDVKSLFDRNHHAVVSEDGDNYYLIDASGKRIGDFTFARIYTYEKSYLAYDADGKRAVLLPSGEKVTDFIYKEAYHEETAEHEIWNLKLESGKYDVIDLTTGKMVAHEVSTNSFYDNYFTVEKDDGGYDFLTYDGVVFYTSQS